MQDAQIPTTPFAAVTPLVSDVKRHRRSRPVPNALNWAKVLIRMRARGFMVAQLTGMPEPAIRQLWQAVNGKASSSGQAPSNLEWYYATPIRQIHSALIVQLFAGLRHMPMHAAVATAYYHYAHLTATDANPASWALSGDPAYREAESDYDVSFARAYELIKQYSDDKFEFGPRKGQRMCELQVKRCNRCGTLYMSHVNDAGKVCGHCAARMH